MDQFCAEQALHRRAESSNKEEHEECISCRENCSDEVENVAEGSQRDSLKKMKQFWKMQFVKGQLRVDNRTLHILDKIY